MIYVDKLFKATPRTDQAKQYGSWWCHMTCDGDLEELHRMAERIGLRRSYFQDHYLLPHYDLTPRKRLLALTLGAQETSTMERVDWALARKGKEETP